MEYPVFYNSNTVGRLRVGTQGLYTFFQARCAMAPGYLRLWLIGGGKCFCLGLMLPSGGSLMLKRKLSRREMAALPSQIERVELSEKEPSLPSPAPKPEAAAEHSKDTDWLPMPDGTLRRRQGDGWLIAFPARLRHPAGRLLSIGGREYLVFRF